MHAYRTHTCAQLRASDVGMNVRVSGWIHRKRDHGGVLFVDLRDHHGLTQPLCEFLADGARQDIGRAARREGHHQAQRLDGVLGLRDAGEQQDARGEEFFHASISSRIGW